MGVMDKFIVDCVDAAGWTNFKAHCDRIYYNSNIVNIVSVCNHELKKQFGNTYPCVKVKTPRTYPAYIRFRNEAEYLAFALKWA